jgi:transposase-like protein
MLPSGITIMQVLAGQFILIWLVKWEAVNMTEEERETRRRKQEFAHVEKHGCAAKTCRYFGIPKSTFYRWKKQYLEEGEPGLNQQ